MLSYPKFSCVSFNDAWNVQFVAFDLRDASMGLQDLSVNSLRKLPIDEESREGLSSATWFDPGLMDRPHGSTPV